MQRRLHFQVLIGLSLVIVAGLVAFAFSGVGALAAVAGVAAFFLVLHAAYGPDDELTFVPVAKRTTPTESRKASTRPTPTPSARKATGGSAAPFQFNGYTLHERRVQLNGGGERTIWFFSKRVPKSGTPAAKPAGYHVGVNERTGLPFLKRGAGKDGEDLTPATADEAYRPQCVALRNDGIQCRNSSRTGSKYCSSHFGYQPRTPEGVVRLTDTMSKVARIDTPTSFAGDATAATTQGAQCQALTATGRGTKQCKNTVRPGSQFCVTHQGYRSPTPQRVVRGRDSQPRVRGAPDTRPAVRRRATT